MSTNIATHTPSVLAVNVRYFFHIFISRIWGGATRKFKILKWSLATCETWIPLKVCILLMAI